MTPEDHVKLQWMSANINAVISVMTTAPPQIASDTSAAGILLSNSIHTCATHLCGLLRLENQWRGRPGVICHRTLYVEPDGNPHAVAVMAMHGGPRPPAAAAVVTAESKQAPAPPPPPRKAVGPPVMIDLRPRTTGHFRPIPVKLVRISAPTPMTTSPSELTPTETKALETARQLCRNMGSFPTALMATELYPGESPLTALPKTRKVLESLPGIRKHESQKSGISWYFDP